MKAIFNAFLVNNKKCLAFKKYRLQIKVNKKWLPSKTHWLCICLFEMIA